MAAGAAWTESSGTFTAIDALTGNRTCQKQFPEACYSGTSTTKGNLVFVGRNNGELDAYDARNGNRLWNFQTGAGANNTASFFEHDGKRGTTRPNSDATTTALGTSRRASSSSTCG